MIATHESLRGQPAECAGQREPAQLAGGTPLGRAIQWAAGRIGEASDSARLDAELLVAHVLGESRERLLMLAIGGAGSHDAGAAVCFDRAQAGALEALVHRRAREREPVAYIVGQRHFRSLALKVDRRALIPRPETELLVEVAHELGAGASLLDLCTGCGAVALAVRDERPDLVVSGSDISLEALALARENAEHLGLEVRWHHADLMDGLADDHDAVLCNPPYVAERDRDALAPEIVRHEPPGALFAGEDGLAVIEALTEQLAARPRVRMVAIEVGAGQADSVVRLVRQAGFARAGARRDLAGVERVVVGERAAAPR
ncbi:MAG: peptide chain release factor N(5)-glutamine methyltransferase [Solirubrobacteraceae bacterium]